MAPTDQVAIDADRASALPRPANPRILVAPDSFKGTYSASEVATAIAGGYGAAAEPCPLADGGEGTTQVLVGAGKGTTTEAEVQDPLGRRVRASIGWIDGGGTAIVEAAQASGFALVAATQRDAESASSVGTGELIAAARRAGARRIVVGAGGTASTDGGAGAIGAIDAAGGLNGVELIVLCDVATPFERAARAYGPQKGADSITVTRLSDRLEACAETLRRDPRRRPMTGAAGGLAGGLWAEYDARLVPGAGWILDALDFDTRVARADAVVSGEGRLDGQTFEGKLVGEIAARCRRADKPLHVVAGSIELDSPDARALGIASAQIARDPTAMRAAGASLARLGPRGIGNGVGSTLVREAL